MRTSVFAHKSVVGIESDLKAEGLVNDPSLPNQLGFVLDALYVDISQEAYEVLLAIPKSGDSIGDVDVFKSTTGVIFSFLGGPRVVVGVDLGHTGSSTYDPTLLQGVANFVPNNPPQAFIDFVDSL